MHTRFTSWISAQLSSRAIYYSNQPKAVTPTPGVFEGRDRATGKVKWIGTRVDLILGSNSQLRVMAENYACADSAASFVQDFASHGTKS
jgi:catalase-peroxidase